MTSLSPTRQTAFGGTVTCLKLQAMDFPCNKLRRAINARSRMPTVPLLLKCKSYLDELALLHRGSSYAHQRKSEPLVSMRARSKRTASCLKKSVGMRSRWVRITFGEVTSGTGGRSPPWGQRTDEPAPHTISAASTMLAMAASISILLVPSCRDLISGDGGGWHLGAQHQSHCRQWPDYWQRIPLSRLQRGRKYIVLVTGGRTLSLQPEGAVPVNWEGEGNEPRSAQPSTIEWAFVLTSIAFTLSGLPCAVVEVVEHRDQNHGMRVGSRGRSGIFRPMNELVDRNLRWIRSSIRFARRPGILRFCCHSWDAAWVTEHSALRQRERRRSHPGVLVLLEASRRLRIRRTTMRPEGSKFQR